ncbi:MAG: hypothetical protein WCF25_09970 [Acidimicrobiales bacterium]
MKIRTNYLSGRSRSAIAGVLASATLLVSIGFGAPSASASSIRSAGPSAFCTTIISYRPATVPNPKNLSSYRAWAKSLEPFYETLAKEAPNASTKAVLNEVVVVLKYYVNSSSVTKLDASVVKYEAKWKAGAKALAAAIISCAKSLE